MITKFMIILVKILGFIGKLDKQSNQLILFQKKCSLYEIDCAIQQIRRLIQYKLDILINSDYLVPMRIIFLFRRISKCSVLFINNFVFYYSKTQLMKVFQRALAFLVLITNSNRFENYGIIDLT